jgi:hypothetical protein
MPSASLGHYASLSFVVRGRERFEIGERHGVRGYAVGGWRSAALEVGGKLLRISNCTIRKRVSVADLVFSNSQFEFRNSKLLIAGYKCCTI